MDNSHPTRPMTHEPFSKDGSNHQQIKSTYHSQPRHSSPQLQPSFPSSQTQHTVHMGSNRYAQQPHNPPHSLPTHSHSQSLSHPKQQMQSMLNYGPNNLPSNNLPPPFPPMSTPSFPPHSQTHSVPSNATIASSTSYQYPLLPSQLPLNKKWGYPDMDSERNDSDSPKNLISDHMQPQTSNHANFTFGSKNQPNATVITSAPRIYGPSSCEFQPTKTEPTSIRQATTDSEVNTIPTLPPASFYHSDRKLVDVDPDVTSDDDNIKQKVKLQDSSTSILKKGSFNLEIINHPDLFRIPVERDILLGSFIYKPSMILPNLEEHVFGFFHMHIPSFYLNWNNLGIYRRSLWGTDVYTDDSDIVAMLIHSCKFSLPDDESYADCDVTAIVRVLPCLRKYLGSLRNGIQSRNWKNHHGVSLKIMEFKKVKKGTCCKRGRKQSKIRTRAYLSHRTKILEGKRSDQLSESYELPFATSGAIMFNVLGEPCLKYSTLFLDGLRKDSTRRLSIRLRKEVLFLETDKETYELSLNMQLLTSQRPSYRLVQASRPVLFLMAKGIIPVRYPLPPEGKAIRRILFSDLNWEDMIWLEDGVQLTDSTWSSMMDETASLDSNLLYPEDAEEVNSTYSFLRISRVYWRPHECHDTTVSRRRFSESIRPVSTFDIEASTVQRRFSETFVGKTSTTATAAKAAEP